MAYIKIPNDFFNQDAQAGGFFPQTHTNPGFDISKFISDTGKNYIIEGIRGSGKTHILKMIYERCLQEYSKKKILPVYVSLSNVAEWIEKDLAIFRIHLYASIVYNAIVTIEKNRQNIELAGYSEMGKSLKRIVQMFGLNEDENFDSILSRIKEAHLTLLNKLTYNPHQILEKSGMNAQSKVGVSVKYGAQMNIEDLINQFEEKQVQYIGRMLSSENASSFLIEFLAIVRIVLKNDYTLLLIDECSEVNKDAQIEVFRLLKLIRGSTSAEIAHNTAYFCASVYPPPVTYYPSKLKGDPFNFDIGHDAVVEYLQVDELSDEYLLFYQELTKKRISVFLKKAIDVSEHGDIFENEKAFILAAFLSNGLVRRYFDILKHSYDNLCQRVGDNSSGDIKKISIKDVEEAADIVASNQIISESKLTEEDFRILDTIFGRISKRNKRNETDNIQKDPDKQLPANVYFTVSRSDFRFLGHLIIQGALHNKGRTRIKKTYKEEGMRGILVMLDLCVAFYESAIKRGKAVEIFQVDLKTNAKSGFDWCQDFQIKSD